MVKVLYVCLGNICRSPTGEATFNAIVKQRGLQNYLMADSAGIMGWHVGKKPDHRTLKNADKHGIAMTHIGRKLTTEDLDAFDHIVVMDEKNFEDVHKFYYESKGVPPPADKLFMIRDYDPEVRGVHEVIDPYYEGEEVFEEVFQILWRSNEALVDHLVDIHHIALPEEG